MAQRTELGAYNRFVFAAVIGFAVLWAAAAMGITLTHIVSVLFGDAGKTSTAAIGLGSTLSVAGFFAARWLIRQQRLAKKNWR